jgi:hypothetical protein
VKDASFQVVNLRSLGLGAGHVFNFLLNPVQLGQLLAQKFLQSETHELA